MSKPVITFVFKVLITETLPLEFSPVVTGKNGQTIKDGTQTLDKNWGHMKRFTPNSRDVSYSQVGLVEDA